MSAQEPPHPDSFAVELILPSTGIKDQGRSSTCWSFSGISLLESELLRMNSGSYDLSEMYVVRHAYEEKARKYVRMHGTINFSGGGAFNDVTDVMGKHGIVPEEVYTGMKTGVDGHVHGEMDDVLKAYLENIIKHDELSPVWFRGFSCLLDTYLGEVPETFEYRGEQYTPVSFAGSMGLKMDDYVLMTSFTHHPFYEPFIIELPDNWSWQEVHNVPLDELTGTIDHSLKSGYTVAWAADVSERYFSRKGGIAMVITDGSEDGQIPEAEQCFSIELSQWEDTVTQKIRQEAFDNYATTDDHGMHIIGLARHSSGKEFYIVKNSWGRDAGPYEGFFYVSKAYVRYKTTDIMVNRNGIPGTLRGKLKL